MATFREKKSPVEGRFKRIGLAIVGILILLAGVLFWRPAAARVLGNVGAIYLDQALVSVNLPAGERDSRLSSARFLLEQSLLLTEDPLTRRRLGRVYLAGGDEAAALAQWRRDAGAADYLVSLGGWLLAQEKLTEAVKVYDAAIQLDAHLPPADYSQLVSLLGDEGRWEEAIRWGELGRQEDRNNASVRFLLGLTYLEASRPAEAVPVWQELVALSPTNLDYALLLGTALVRAGRSDEGVTQYRQTIQQLAPDAISELTGGDFLRIGQSLSNFGYWSEAIVALERAVALTPDSAQGHYWLGWAYYQGGRGATVAVAELEKAQQLNPNLAAVYCRLSELWRQEKNLPEAEKWALAGTQQLPNNVDVWLALTVTRYNQNRAEDARVAIERALALAPNDATVCFWAGLVYNRLGQPVVAATYLKEAVRLSPQKVDYGLALGDAYLSLGWRDAALQEFQRVAQLAPNDTRIQERLRRLP